MTNRLDEWRELERLLRGAFATLAERFDARLCAFVTEMLDNQEYGIAYEAMAEAIHEGGIRPDTATLTSLRSAANMMGLPEPRAD